MMLSTQEFAAHWGVAPKTVRRWIDDDLVEAMQAYPGGPYYISEEELHRFHPSDARRDSVRRSSFTVTAGSSSWGSHKREGQRKSRAFPTPPRTIKPWVGGKRNA